VSTITVTPGQRRALETLFSLFDRQGIVVDAERFEELVRDPAQVQREIRRLLPKGEQTTTSELLRDLQPNVNRNDS
jgi:hypothetical protein